MDEKNIIARKVKNKIHTWLVAAALMLAAAVLFLVEGIINKDYIYFILLCVWLAVAAIFIILAIIEKNRPEVLIYAEGGVLHFYNGIECRPEDILDIKSGYNSTRYGTALHSGTLTVYTNKGKVTCRGISDIASATTAVMSFKYGRLYTTAELKAALSSRAARRREL